MKTYLSCTLAGFALLANITYAGGREGYGVPAGLSLYAGGSVGTASQKGACGAISTAEDFISSNECNDSGTGYKVFAGTRIAPSANPRMLPTLGAEAGYINFGESTAKGHILRSPGGFDTQASSELSAVYAAGVGYLPVAPRVELLGKAGIAHWQQDGKYEVPDDTDRNTSISSSGTRLLLGAGAQYQVNNNLSVRGEYEQIQKTVSDTPFASDASLLSVGAVFSTL
jgi:opacity protein-like surface antigen